MNNNDEQRRRVLSLPTITRVAVSDTGWLVILLPLAFVFRLLLMLASAYYRLRRKSPLLGGAYVVGVLTAAGWLGMRVVRLWRE